MVEEKFKLTLEEAEFMNNLMIASQIVMIEDEELLKELAKY